KAAWAGKTAEPNNKNPTMNPTVFFTLPFYPRPDESKAGLKPGRSWFEINPTCSPVFVAEGTGLIFQTHCTHAALTPPPLRRTLASTMLDGFDAACCVRVKPFYAARHVAQLYVAFAKVKELVADFRANEKFYRSPAYQEFPFAHRMGEGGRRPDEGNDNRDFIDKFWLALGWDVNHENLDGETHKFQGLNFQNWNALDRMRSRSDGRCLFKKETFASDGCHSVERQQRHRIKIRIHSSCARNQGLAAAPAVAWQTRFRFPETAPRSVCGWLFLAPMSVALPDASR